MIVGEETEGNLTMYIYDSAGMPLGMQYHGADYVANRWDTYWFEKNIQGDIVAVYDAAGTKLIGYFYDAWGNFTTAYYDNAYLTSAVNNPFTYRGYYYDRDLGLYYLNSRYYDSNIGRFISPDAIDTITASPTALTDKNLYAYCDNNPVMRADYGGEFWHIIIGAVVGAAVNLVSSIVSEIVEGDFTWSDLGQIAVSTVVGAAEGALIAAAPGLTMLISGAANAAETAINGAIDGDSIERIATDSIVSGLFGAFAGSSGSDFIKGGKLLNQGFVARAFIKKGLTPAIRESTDALYKSAWKYIGISYLRAQKDSFSYGKLEVFTSKAIRRLLGIGR